MCEFGDPVLRVCNHKRDVTVKKSFRLSYFSLTILVALGLAFPASAQWDMLTPQLNAIEFGRQNEQSADAAQGYDDFADFDIASSLTTALVAPSPTQQLSAPRAIDTRYRYKRDRTAKNLESFIKRTLDQQARSELKRMLDEQPGIIDDVRAGIAGYGLDTHDVADAYALWWINAWLVANKLDEDPDKGTIAMVKQQVKNAIGATPDFARTTDAQRQEYAEALILQGTMLASAFEQFQGKPDLLNHLADAALKGAKASGMDLSLMTLTKNGFVPRQQADASGSLHNEATEIQLASAAKPQTTPSKDGSSLRTALAAGAGIGVVLLGGAFILKQRS